MTDYRTVSVRVGDKPISNFLEMFTGSNGKKQCRFISFSSSTDTPVSADNAIHSAVSDAHPADDALTPSNVCDSTNTYSVTSPSLPDFVPTSGATFTWGSLDSQSFCNALNSAYQEVVNWKSNCFRIPSGKCGKRFVSELARLFRAAGEKSALESIAIKAASLYVL